MALINPTRVSGTNDYTPEQMAQRRALLAKIMDVYTRFGFEELETPALEGADVLLGEEGDNLIWRTQTWSVGKMIEGLNAKIIAGEITHEEAMARLTSKTAESEVALRFDHTVPLARYVAANMGTLRLPWRRWCFGPVWRGDTPGAGRYRQFHQLDADIVGDSSLAADAEVIWMMTEVLSAVTPRSTGVRWSSRKLLNALALCIGLTGDVLDNESGQVISKTTILFRTLDKLEKIGRDGVIEELAREPANAFDTTALALQADQIRTVERFLQATQAGDTDDAFTKLYDLVGNVPTGAEGIADMRTVCEMLAALGVTNARVDFSVARGLGYYTGPVFESWIDGQTSSPMSGGRFDGLIARFTGSSLPSTGVSVGFDRLFSMLEEAGDLPELRASPVDVIVADFGASRDAGGSPTVRDMTLDVLARIRRLGVSARIYDGENPRKMSAVISYALRIGASHVAIIGENEAAAGKVAIKHLASRAQNLIELDELQRFLKDT